MEEGWRGPGRGGGASTAAAAEVRCVGWRSRAHSCERSRSSRERTRRREREGLAGERVVEESSTQERERGQVRGGIDEGLRAWVGVVDRRRRCWR